MFVNIDFGQTTKEVNFSEEVLLQDFAPILLEAISEQNTGITREALEHHYTVICIKSTTGGRGSGIILDLSLAKPVSQYVADDEDIQIRPGVPPHLLPEPQPLQLIDFGEPTAENPCPVTLNEDNCRFVLDNFKTRNLPIVVVSLAGPFRTGKSFMLNLFLRYLKYGDDWDKMDSQKLEGFGWKHGVKRDTVGIWMWSEVFVRKLSDGKEVGVVLVDTQGTFDNTMTMNQNTRIFALNALISSRQVYNIKEKVSEDYLQHMHLFTSFGAQIMKRHGIQRPFQCIEFLVRDWEFDDHKHGRQGGREYIGAVLHQSEEMAEELREVRNWLDQCFESVDCFLLPDPGKKIKKPEFTGDLSVVEDDFRELVHKYVPETFSPSNLVVKRMAGETVTAVGLCNYIRQYVEAFNANGELVVDNIVRATVRPHIDNMRQAALKKYEDEMDKIAGPKKPFCDPKRLDEDHTRVYDEVLENFRHSLTFGTEQDHKQGAERLSTELEKMYEKYREINLRKNVLHALRAPIAFAVLAVIINILATFLDIVELDSLAYLLGYITWTSALAFLAWAALHFSGQNSDILHQLDEFGAMVWAHLMEVGQRLVAMLAKNRVHEHQD